MHTTRTRMALAASLLTTLTLTACSTSAAAQAIPMASGHVRKAATAPSPVVRIGGTNAVATAAAVALRQFPHGANTVMLAPGGTAWTQEYAVLAASPLAAAENVPIVLTPTPTQVGPAATTVARLHAKTVILIGADNNSVLKKALSHQKLRVQGLGSGNPAATGAAVAHALLAATGQTAISSVFLVAPNDIGNDISASSAAAWMQSPVLVTNAPAHNAITLPAPEVSLVNQVTTAYELGKLAFGGVSGLPSGAMAVPFRGAAETDTLGTAEAVNNDFFSAPFAVLLANNSPAALPAALAAGPYAANLDAAIVPIAPKSVPADTQAYLSTLAPHTFTPVVLGSPNLVPVNVAAGAVKDAGGTAFATLDQMNMAFLLKGAKFLHQAFPELPANGPNANAQTMGLMNNPAVIAKYGGPKLPVSLKAAGLTPNTPSNGAITGLTAQVVTNLVDQAGAIPATSAVPPATIEAGIRFAARYAALNAGNTGLSTLLSNAEAPMFVSVRPHLQTSVSQTTASLDSALLPGRIWVYRAWVSMGNARITAYTPPIAPAGAVRSAMEVTGLTLHLIMSSVGHGKLTIGLYTIPNVWVAADLIQQGSVSRWYFDNETTWYTGAPTTVYWTDPVKP